MTRKPNLIERIGLALAGGYIREATGDTIDPDDPYFRRLTDNRRDLNPLKHERAQDISLHLWRSNPMAKRMIEMIVDFTVGADGIEIVAASDATQRVIDDFWNDPVMELAHRHRGLVRDLSIYGELAFRKNVNDVSKRMRVGYIDVRRIEDILPDPDNMLVDRTMLIRRSGMNPEEVALVRWVDGEDATAAGTDVSGSWQGDGFYFGINRITGQHRGNPDLLALADWVDGYDQLLFNALERSGLINAFIYDVTLTGADDGAVDTWMQKHGTPPPPGTVRVHNEKETWQAVAPNLATGDVTEIGRAVKNMALGGAGLPEAWFAEGDSANRATLAAQGDPTYKMLKSRQQEVERMFERIIAVGIQEATGGRIPTDSDLDFQIVLPDLDATDTSEIATALPQVASAMTTAIAEELIDTKSARSLFLAVAAQLGVDLDPQEVEKQIEAEAAERKADEEARNAELAAMAATLGGPPAPAPAGPAQAGPQRPPAPKPAPGAPKPAGGRQRPPTRAAGA